MATHKSLYDESDRSVVCPLGPDVNAFTLSIEKLNERINSMIALQSELLIWHKQVIRWLLGVVCIIALGKSAIDFGRDILAKEVPAAHAITEYEDRR